LHDCNIVYVCRAFSVPISKKKKFKIQRKKKSDGINTFHKKKGKGKRK